MNAYHPYSEIMLHYYTPAQLARIQTCKVGVAGVGGLGSNIVHALVRSGFEDFQLLDNDNVELSNLNRQNYYPEEIGLSKVEATSKRLKQINPDIRLSTCAIRLTAGNARDFFVDRDIVFEAFDNVESKKLFLESYGNTGKLLICGSGMAGFRNDPEIRINRLRDNLYVVGDGVTSVSSATPPLAPRVMVCAALMASVAVERVLA